MSTWKTVNGPFRFVEKPGRQPSNETGLYLFQHKHRWIEGMPHTWPSGDRVPTWRCSVCGDVICTEAKVETR
jgi:hypothetical protein